MEHISVAAFDPGLLTGVALVHFNDQGCHQTFTGEANFESMMDLSDQLIKHATHVASEKFTITAKTAQNSQAPWSLRVEGIIIATAAKHDVPITMQSPASAKQFVNNDMLKRLELWHRGGAGHANDALRHAVTFAVRNGWRDARLMPSHTS